MFLLTVAALWGVAAVTPGPNFFVVAHQAVTGSRRLALAIVAGTITGTLCWGLAGWLGIGAVFAAAPMAYVTLKVVGGAYLVWLGLRLLWQARKPASQTTATAAVAMATPLRAWRQGLATSLANPKSALFVASLFAATLQPNAPWTHGASAVVMMVAISALWYGGVALVLSRPPVALAYRRARRAIDAVAGAVFLAFGGRLALSNQ